MKELAHTHIKYLESSINLIDIYSGKKCVSKLPQMSRVMSLIVDFLMESTFDNIEAFPYSKYGQERYNLEGNRLI